MRLRWLALLLFGLPLCAQQTIPTFQYVTSAPSGACSGTPPIQVIYATAAMYACASNVWVLINGSGSGGVVSNGNLGQNAGYLAQGTTVSGYPNMYTINPAWTQAQVNSFFAGLSGTNTVFIPQGTPEAVYSYNGQVPHSFKLGSDWFQMPGVACDGKQSALTIPITQGSNLSTVNSLLSASDVGKTFFFFNKSGYAFGLTQSVWTAQLVSYTFPNSTWSANAPFASNTQVYYGSDNLAAVETAMTQANSVFPLTIPTGCYILVNGTIPWNNNQVIVGRHKNTGGFIGRPGADTIATTGTSGQSVSSAGTGLGGFRVAVGTEIDATLGYNLYAANGTLTVVPPIYRPAKPHTPIANHPCAPGWVVGCKMGVASTTQASAVMCTPNAIAPPAVGSTIVFPYLPKVFTTTVSSTAGSCSGGFTARTLAAALPNATSSTVAQNEWLAGTSVQNTTTSIPGAPEYPYTLQLSNATKPVPGWPSNFSQHGHAKIQDYEFDYMGVNYLTNTIVVRRGPASVNGGSGYSGTNSIVALNPCPAEFDQPWPVTPSINAASITSWSITSNVATFQATNTLTVGQIGYLGGFSQGAFFNGQLVTVISTGLSGTQFEINFTHGNGSVSETGSFNQTTPTGADYFPGECIGNAGIAFPQDNGDVYAGTGLSGGFLSDLYLLGTNSPGSNSQNQNNAAGIYVAGNNAPFASHIENNVASSLQYDYVQGPASSGQHGVAAVGPTGFGNTFHNLWFFGASPLTFADMQGSKIDEMNMNSAEYSPYDGTEIGSGNCLTMWYTLDPQTGQTATSTNYDHLDTYGCEPEGGSNIEVLPAVAVAGSHISFDTANFEGIPNVFAGDHLKITNSFLGLPTIDYGANNDFGTVDGSNAGYPTNLWDGNPQFLEWGQNGQCMSYLGSLGAPQACGPGTVQGYGGRTTAPSVTGSKAYYELGGRITPWMWDNNGAFDGNPMTTSGQPDTTASYWGASATCALGGGALCQTDHFAQNVAGFLFIGPLGQLYDGPYILDASFKTLSASSSFTLTINVVDSGSLQCASGTSPVQIYSGTVSTTTSFASFHNATGSPIDFTGHAGCALQVQFLAGSTTDTVVVDRFNLIPAPQTVWLPTAAPTIGATCAGPNAIIGSDATHIYACLNGLVVGIT